MLEKGSPFEISKIVKFACHDIFYRLHEVDFSYTIRLKIEEVKGYRNPLRFPKTLW